MSKDMPDKIIKVNAVNICSNLFCALLYSCTNKAFCSYRFKLCKYFFNLEQNIGTFKTLSKAQLVYGIDTHMNPNYHSNVKNLLSIPFQPYRVPKVSKLSVKPQRMAENS